LTHHTIRAIGDIHGEADALAEVLQVEDAAPHFLFLGDLVDRGPDSAGVLQTVLSLVQTARATLVRSNHDDKLFRHLKGNKVTLNAELEETLRQLAAHPHGELITTNFQALYSQAPHWLTIGTYTFAHGAFHPDMLELASPAEGINRKAREMLAWLSLYGESTMRMEDDKPTRTYDWVDTISAGHTVVVGHDARSWDAPFECTGALSGAAIFMDTGCGKGGPLSWRDFEVKTT